MYTQISITLNIDIHFIHNININITISQTSPVFFMHRKKKKKNVCCRGDTASGWRMKSHPFKPACLLWARRGDRRSSARPYRRKRRREPETKTHLWVWQVHTETQIILEPIKIHFMTKGIKVFQWNLAQSVQADILSATMWPHAVVKNRTKSHLTHSQKLSACCASPASF